MVGEFPVLVFILISLMCKLLLFSNSFTSSFGLYREILGHVDVPIAFKAFKDESVAV